MMALALPFAYLHVREGRVSFKIFTGVMLGVAFYGMNKLFAHIGLLNTWPPLVVSALPSLVVLSIGIRRALLDRAAVTGRSRSAARLASRFPGRKGVCATALAGLRRNLQ